MGASKSVPVVGEVVTTVDVSCKAAVGLAVSSFSEEQSKKFLSAAKTSFDEYWDRSPVVAAASTPFYLRANDTDALKEHWSKVGNSCVEVVDGMPVVGHIKGAVHYAMGDKDHGDHCMKAASRSTVCAMAIAGTLGSGAFVVASSSVAAGLMTDIVTTTVDSKIHEEFRPSGQVAAVYHAMASGDPVAYFDAAGNVAFECVMTYMAATQAEQIAQKQNSTRLYRIMDEKTAKKTVGQQKIQPGRAAGLKPLGETWVSETLEHSKAYLPQQQGKINVPLETVEFQVQNNYYHAMKAKDCLKQQGSSAVNAAGKGAIKNVFNTEHVASQPSGMVNLGIKNANLDMMNKHISSAKIIDLQSWRYRNGATKFVSRYGADVGGTVATEMARSGAARQRDKEECSTGETMWNASPRLMLRSALYYLPKPPF